MPQAFVTLFCEAIKAVLRTLSGHRDVAPCRIRSPASAAPPGRHTGTLAGRQKRKKPIRQDGLFTCLMPGSLWRASCRHPPGRCCATFKSAPGGFVLLRRALTDKQQIKQKPGLSTGLSALFDAWQFPTLTWGDPHYHRRYGVSLLSSAWGQVGPPR